MKVSDKVFIAMKAKLHGIEVPTSISIFPATIESFDSNNVTVSIKDGLGRLLVVELPNSEISSTPQHLLERVNKSVVTRDLADDFTEALKDEENGR